jgi:hypothetical protein
LRTDTAWHSPDDRNVFRLFHGGCLAKHAKPGRIGLPFSPPGEMHGRIGVESEVGKGSAFTLPPVPVKSKPNIDISNSSCLPTGLSTSTSVLSSNLRTLLKNHDTRSGLTDPAQAVDLARNCIQLLTLM